MPSYNITSANTLFVLHSPFAHVVSVDDASPVIQFSGLWSDASQDSDGDALRYRNGTLHKAVGVVRPLGNLSVDQNSEPMPQGAQANISFWGTAVQVFGSRKQAYVRPRFPSCPFSRLTAAQGNFSVALDKASVSTISAKADGPTYQDLIYSSPALAAGQHNLVLSSTGSDFDLDYVVITAGDGQACVAPRPFTST
jgi:hypothetical protein